MLFVDTSTLINYLKGSNSPACQYLAEIERSNTPFALPSFCLQEVLQGAADEKSWKALNKYLSSQITVAPKDKQSSYIAAARIYYDCRRKGLTVRSSTDCLIAQITLENNGLLLHEDKDFNLIAKVCRLKFPRF